MVKGLVFVGWLAAALGSPLAAEEPSGPSEPVCREFASLRAWAAGARADSGVVLVEPVRDELALRLGLDLLAEIGPAGFRADDFAWGPPDEGLLVLGPGLGQLFVGARGRACVTFTFSPAAGFRLLAIFRGGA